VPLYLSSTIFPSISIKVKELESRGDGGKKTEINVEGLLNWQVVTIQGSLDS